MSELDKDTQEAWDYTLEMLTDYERTGELPPLPEGHA